MIKKHDDWMLAEELDSKALADIRDQMVKLAASVIDVNPAEIKFTCDDCPINRKCSLAFDIYNMDGDCLLEK